jgi:hypothetical protein
MIKGKKGRGKIRKQLPDDFKGTLRYWNFKEEALDRNLWRSCFERVYGPVAKCIFQEGN